MLEELREEIKKLASPEKAKASAWFFKTKEGEYGYGDIFLGLTVPEQRLIAKKYITLSRSETIVLLHSKYHEERLIALFILIHQFKKGDEKEQKEIYDLYLANTRYINNWDLVDSSAGQIVGEYLYRISHSGAEQSEAIESHMSEILSVGKASIQDDKEKRLLRAARNDKCLEVLEKLACSENLWERRIAIIATFGFIKYGESDITLTIVEILVHDAHDLIQKAVGWLLREVGKRISESDEKKFLAKYYKTMPRTMLRYAIERFPEEERQRYLKNLV